MNKTCDGVNTYGKMAQVRMYTRRHEGDQELIALGVTVRLWAVAGILRSRRGSCHWLQVTGLWDLSFPKMPAFLISQNGIHVSPLSEELFFYPNAPRCPLLPHSFYSSFEVLLSFWLLLLCLPDLLLPVVRMTGPVLIAYPAHGLG